MKKFLVCLICLIVSASLAEDDVPYHIIKLKYAYAPGIAMILGGTPIYYSDIDPWVGSIVGNRSSGSGRGFGQTQNPSSGGDFGGFSSGGQGFSGGF